MLARSLFLFPGFVLCVIQSTVAEDAEPDDDEISFEFRTKFNREYIAGQKKLVCRRVSVPPKIDGKLDDACWKIADRTKSAFVQIKTKNPNRRQMAVYTCFDDQKVYLAYVCEEPELKKIRMRKGKGPMKRFGSVWADDCVEGFFEIGAVDGGGKVFQILVNLEACEDYYIRTKDWNPTWEYAGSKGANRWIVEIAMPFDQFTFGDYRYEGPPIRGEVWGLKLNREGKDLPGGEEKLLSCWEYNPYDSFLIIGHSGMLIFEDENLLRNGTFVDDENDDRSPDHWYLVKSSKEVKAKLSYDEEQQAGRIEVKLEEGEVVQLRQDIRVRKLSHYIYSAQLNLENFEGRAFLAIDDPPTEKELLQKKGFIREKMKFRAELKQQKAGVLLTLVGGSGSVLIDEMRVEERRNLIESGVVCLTGNAPQQHLNTVKTDGAYTYKFPGTDLGCFPWTYKYSYHWERGEPDEGGATGWIPFEKGSITGRPSQVTWPMAPREKMLRGKPSAYIPIDIEFDLKKDYFIRQIDILPVFPTLANIHVYVRPERRKDFVHCTQLNGAGVLNPPGIVNYGRIEDIDSVARFVKIRVTPPPRNIVGAGIDEIRIYGEEKGTHKDTDIKPFIWKQGLVVETPPVAQFKKLEEVFIYPQPLEMKLTKDALPITGATTIVTNDSGRNLKFAKQIQEELEEGFLIRLPIVEESSFRGVPRKAIILGQPETSPLVKSLCAQEKIEVSPTSPGPQGYHLTVNSNYALIAGSDEAGVFYGVQSLMQVARRTSETSQVFQGIKAQDRPYIKQRAVGGQTFTFHIEPPDMFRRFTRGMARLKINQFDVDYGWYNRDKEQKEKLVDYYRFADEHCMTFTTWMGAGPGMSTGARMRAEIGTDEDYEDITKTGSSRVNPCPSEMYNYENYFDRMDSKVPFSPARQSRYVHITLDEMYQWNNGSRWHVCKKCRDRGLSGGELYAEHIVRIHDYIKRHGRETMGLNTVLQYRVTGGFQGMSHAYDLLPRDMVMDLYHGGEGEEHDPIYSFKSGFERIRPWYGRGRRNRSKVHGYYWPDTEVWARPAWNWSGVFIHRMFGGSNSDNVMRFIEGAWSPDNPSVHKEEFSQRHGNAIIRFKELVTGIEFPSWRLGVPKRYHTIDLRKYSNWSHTDDKLLDNKGWLDYGGNYDLRNLPKGTNKFAGEVPFEIIDPVSNGDRSISIVTDPPESHDEGRFPDGVEIEINQPAASLLILRTSFKTGALPNYSVHFEGGGTMAIPMAGSDWRTSYGYTNKPITDPDAGTLEATHRMSWALDFQFRPAWFGHTPSGDEVSLYMFEWVNPHPEKSIRSLEIWFDPLADRTAHHEVLLALTVIEPLELDRRIWQGRDWRAPLVTDLPAERYKDEEVAPLLTGGKEKSGSEWLILDGEKQTGEFKIKGLAIRDRHQPSHPYFGSLSGFAEGRGITRNLRTTGEPIVIHLDEPSPVCRVEATGFGRGGWTHGLQYCDYTVEVSPDGKAWKMVASNEGVTLESGEQVHDFEPIVASWIRLSIDGKRYKRNQVIAGLASFQVYRRVQKK